MKNMKRARLRTALIAPLVPVALFLTAAEASAAISCELNGTTLTVTVTGYGSFLDLDTGEAGEIYVVGGGLVRCSGGDPTVTNVDTIRISDTSEGNTRVTVIYAERFAPGATDEPGTSDEIELEVSLGAGGDELRIIGDESSASRILGGTAGINVNGFEPEEDIDVTIAEVEFLTIATYAGDDVASLAGGGIYGAPLSISTDLSGWRGNDLLTGGDASDFLSPGLGDDEIDGGNGDDVVSYSDSEPAVRIDLPAGLATGQGTDTLASIESASGSEADDVLIGTDDANWLDGSDGSDLLRGGGGQDTIVGGFADESSEVDTADYRDAPAAVAVDLGVQGPDHPPQDTGGAGVDVLIRIENVRGSMHPDVLGGTSGRNRLAGLGGADLVKGRAGSDVLLGGEDDDLLLGRADDDALRGQRGDDRLRGGTGTDSCIGGPGIDAASGCEA